MTSDNLTVSYDREYWVAIQPSKTSTINVFGPYSLAQANNNRTDWLRTYPASARISAVFRAESRERAELDAVFYMPK